LKSFMVWNNYTANYYLIVSSPPVILLTVLYVVFNASNGTNIFLNNGLLLPISLSNTIGRSIAWSS
jgi:hypothetical protein